MGEDNLSMGSVAMYQPNIIGKGSARANVNLAQSYRPLPMPLTTLLAHAHILVPTM